MGSRAVLDVRFLDMPRSNWHEGGMKIERTQDIDVLFRAIRPAAWLAVVFWVGMATAAAEGKREMTTQNTITKIRLVLPEGAGATAGRIASLFKRHLQSRCPAIRFVDDESAWTIRGRIEAGVGAEGFEIVDIENGVAVTGHDERGLLYGLGRLLKTSRCTDEGFLPGSWRGRSKPDCSNRTFYFATHFYNFFHVGPIEENVDYIQESALLHGINTLMVWFDMYHFNGINDPRVQEHLARLKKLFEGAKAIGLDLAFVVVSNEGYHNAPKALFATHGGYSRKDERSLCPAKPEGSRLIHTWHRELYEAFKAFEVKHVTFWPYDDGGCHCDKCKPWGANGFLKVAEDGAAVARTVWPACKVGIGTWCFDNAKDPEWAPFVKALSPCPEWLNYVLTDSDQPHPKFWLKKRGVRDIPELHPSVSQVNFPRAAGVGRPVCGKYGANPKPSYYQRLWDLDGTRLDGGVVYLEGIYGDINAIIAAGFYWDKQTSARTSVAAYIAYEFSPAVVEDVLAAIDQMEKAQSSGWRWKNKAKEDALALLTRAEGKLPRAAKRRWRWRMLYCRAVLDSVHSSRDDKQAARKELYDMYHCQANTHKGCRP